MNKVQKLETQRDVTTKIIYKVNQELWKLEQAHHRLVEYKKLLINDYKALDRKIFELKSKDPEEVKKLLKSLGKEKIKKIVKKLGR